MFIAVAGGVSITTTGQLAVLEEVALRKNNTDQWTLMYTQTTVTPTIAGGTTASAGTGLSATTFTASGTLTIS